MEHPRHPLVSIGLPVYNGESGIVRALDGLLGQDYSNLEILISDNASTDATQRICEQYARQDPRVKYFRSPLNHPVGWNFNRVFELSSGEYFMWAAHDDQREPTFVSACVERMEQCPDAVLCQAYTAVSVQGRPGILYVARLDSFEAATSLVGRYRETLKQFPATAIYGLVRAPAMRATHLFREVMGTEASFIQELSIHGRFVQVPRVLFRYCARETWNTIDQDARMWRAKAKERWYFPFMRLFADHSHRLACAEIPVWMKLRLWTVLAAHESRRLLLRSMIRLAGMCCPASKKEAVGRAVYRRWLQNRNLEVVSADLFMERVCKPQLGWWS